jgi:hypothetical protein
MPRHCGLHNLAVIRCLIAVWLLWPQCAQAQDPPDHAARQQQQSTTPDSYAEIIAELSVLRSLLSEAVEMAREQIGKYERGKPEDDRREDGDLYAQQVMAWAAVAMAVFTLSQFVVGVITLIYLKNTFRENRRTADAAVRAAVAAEATHGAETRPWLGIESIGHAPFAVGQPLSVSLVLRNAGKGPALDVTPIYRGAILRRGEEPATVDRTLPRELATVMPGGNFFCFPMTGMPPIDQQIYDGIIRGDLIVWIVGEITYRGTHTVGHQTNFRLTYRTATNGFAPPVGGGNDAT